MRPDPVSVRPETPIRRLVEDYIYRYDFKFSPVVSESQDLIGCVTTADVKAFPKNEWDRHSVAPKSFNWSAFAPESGALKVPGDES